MKRLLFVLTLGAALACPALAQSTDSASTNTPPDGPPDGPPPGEHHHDMKFLTDAEKAELHKAHDDAIAANPALGTEEKDLMDQMKEARDSGEPPSDDLKEQMHAFHDKMDAAMIAADPAVQPIIEKIKAHHHGPPDGPPPPPSGQ